jgi:hypothetical protein
MVHPMEVETITDVETAVTHRVHLTWKIEGLRALFPLLARGVILKARTGASVKTTLCEQLSVSGEYVNRRIRAIFLNGKTVDDADAARVDAGATLAVSGLIPEPFLRHAVGWRPPREQGDSPRVPLGKDPGAGRSEVFFTLKIFNVLVGELGWSRLGSGVWIRPQVFEDFFHGRGPGFWAMLLRATVDDEDVNAGFLSTKRWSNIPGLIRLSIDGGLQETKSQARGFLLPDLIDFVQ